MTLTEIPIRDYRDGGLLRYATDQRAGARRLMETVLDGLGFRGRLLRPFLPLADRVAAKRLEAMRDPYRAEILAVREVMTIPGPVAFSLSYEFGCTTRAFETGVLFRTLDWPFQGLGPLIEIVRLSGPAGDWTTATWPGLVGVLHGTAPGRFAIALNQAPQQRIGLGRMAAWLWSKWRFLNSNGLPPPHLLRQVFEHAPDADAARMMLSEMPVAVPVIYTLLAPDGRSWVIERTETATKIHDHSHAANHFRASHGKRWRSRGHDSEGRARAAGEMAVPPELDRLAPPILNPLTRLAVRMSTDGGMAVVGYAGLEPVTHVTELPR